MQQSPGTIGVLLSTLLLTACETGTGRHEGVQLIVFWAIVLSPLLATRLKNKSPAILLLILGLQLVAFWFYEIGMSDDFNLRPDLLLILAAVIWNVILVVRSMLRDTGKKDPG